MNSRARRARATALTSAGNGTRLARTIVAGASQEWLIETLEAAGKLAAMITDELRRRRDLDLEIHPTLEAAARAHGLDPITMATVGHDNARASDARKAAAWWMHHHQGMDYDEIAEAIGRAESTARYLVRQHHRRLGIYIEARRRTHKLAKLLAETAQHH